MKGEDNTARTRVRRRYYYAIWDEEIPPGSPMPDKDELKKEFEEQHSPKKVFYYEVYDTGDEGDEE